MRIGLTLLLIAGSAFSQEKLPVPESAAQKEQEQLIRKIFKDEYAKIAPAEKKALGTEIERLYQFGRR